MITEMKAGHLKDIDKPSEPFEVIGKIIPRYENENWTFTELLYEAPYLKSYQDEEDEEDEEADCLEYIDNTDKIIYLYYQDDKCVGKVKLRKNWNRYAYIEDNAVCKDFRGQGIGSALINISIEWAKHKNLHGLMLETQDNNLIACKFYHNCGFKIGSVDTMLYANFENNFEKAVFWYLRF
ncbi:TPA: streptothricin N-acetyltransferase Sat4 [Streptococcus pyogenes]